MSEENIATLRGAYAAMTRGDLEGLLVQVHPDAQFKSLIAEVEGENFRGHDGVRRWWNGVVLPLGGLTAEPVEVRDLGDTAIAQVLATYRPRGVQVRQTVWHVVRFRDGMAAQWDFFRTEEEALGAAGIELD